MATESIQAGFVFMFSYMKKCMFLPGHCDHWNTIVEMGEQSMWAIPRT